MITTIIITIIGTITAIAIGLILLLGKADQEGRDG